MAVLWICIGIRGKACSLVVDDICWAAVVVTVGTEMGSYRVNLCIGLLHGAIQCCKIGRGPKHTNIPKKGKK